MQCILVDRPILGFECISSIEFGILLVKKKEIIYEFAILKKKDYPREIILNIIL